MSDLAIPIILVHGLFGHLRDERILAAFGDTRVHTPDLIGYGIHQDANVEELSLDDQAAHIAAYVDGLGCGKVHLVGHSVGGAVCAVVCELYPELVASLTSVEGNFTLKDAFWSARVAEMSDAEVEGIIEVYRADPDSWMQAAGVAATRWTSELAKDWLANQPAKTIKAQAKAVINATGDSRYLDGIRRSIEVGLPFNLIAGARSSGGWDVPDWVTQRCAIRFNIPNAGHLMMVENSMLFANSVLTCCRFQETIAAARS